MNTVIKTSRLILSPERVRILRLSLEPLAASHKDPEVRRVAQGIMSSLNAAEQRKADRPVLWKPGHNTEGD